MAISVRGKTTFFVTILGSIVSLVMSIGFIYLTLPTTGGLMLAAFASAAAAYLGSIILYNVFMLQNKEKSNSSELKESKRDKIAQSPTPSEMKKNKAKAYLFALITTGCILMVAGTNAITTYQSVMLLGDSLSYNPLIVFIASIAFASILGLGVLLAGYDQTYKFFYLIKGESLENQDQPDNHPYQPILQASHEGNQLGLEQSLQPSQLLDSELKHSSTTKTEPSIKEGETSVKQEDLSGGQNKKPQNKVIAETSIGSNNFFKSKQDAERELHNKNKGREEENKSQRERRYSSPAVFGSHILGD